MNRTTILIDIDDTILDMRQAFEVFHDLRFNNSDEFTEYLFSVGQEKSDEMFKAFEEAGGYENLKPLPGAKDFLDSLHRDGYHIVFVTARYERLKQASLSTLRALYLVPVVEYPKQETKLDEYPHYMYPWELICVGQCHSKVDKVPYIEELNALCLVDDHYKYKHSEDERVIYFDNKYCPSEFTRVYYKIIELEKKNDRL